MNNIYSCGEANSPILCMGIVKYYLKPPSNPHLIAIRSIKRIRLPTKGFGQSLPE